MKRVLLAIASIVLAGQSFAGFEPRTYMERIEDIVRPSKTYSTDDVYASKSFQRPGPYPFVKGMTAADLIRKAGGLAPQFSTGPNKRKPSHVLVFRRTTEDRDPSSAFFEFPLRLGKKKFRIEDCDFPLQPADVVELAFYGVKR